MDDSAVWAGDIAVGFLVETATTGATTLLTVPQGRTWIGTVSVMCAVNNAAANTAAGVASAVIATAGTGVTPAAATVAECVALAGANLAGGTVGDSGSSYMSVPLVVRAPTTNVVTLTLATFVSGSGGDICVTASGVLAASDVGR